MARIFMLAVLGTAGCEKDLLANLDASIDAATPDLDAAVFCKAPTTDAHPAAAYTVFLEFEGVTLTRGVDDSRINRADWLVNDPTVVPRYLPNDSDTVRQGRIDLIVGYAQRALAPYSVDIVTTRPATGNYLMVVLGGDAAALGFQAGNLGIAPATCMPDSNRNLVSIQFDAGVNAINQASGVLSDIALMSGLSPSQGQCDCTDRGAAPKCPTVDSLLCTFGKMAPTANNATNCGHFPTQDEPALLEVAFGCR